MENYFLYVLLFPNGNRYFGITKTISRRFASHKREASRGNPHRLYQAIREHGIGNIKFKVLQSGTKEKIQALEIERIKRYKTQDSRFGYNISPGGTLGPGLKGILNPMYGKPGVWAGKVGPQLGKKMSSEFIKRNSLLNSGPNNPMYGRKHSEESKIKQSLRAQINNKGDGNPRSKLSEAQVRQILEDTRSTAVIAQEYRVGLLAIRRIKDRISWQHLNLS